MTFFLLILALLTCYVQNSTLKEETRNGYYIFVAVVAILLIVFNLF